MSDEITPGSGAGPRIREIPDGDTIERLVCPDCGYVQYDNPKIVVGSVASWRGQILLCRRNINPRKGFWTIPAGYLELKETPLEGARREAMEEANANLAIDRVLSIYAIPRISQVQIIYRAELIGGKHRPGPESQETALFEWDELPWDDLAFPSVGWALTQHRSVVDRPDFAPFTNPANETGDFEINKESKR